MDEGLPIAYLVLDEGIPVYTAEGVQVGTVDHVVAARAEDIFHGIVLRIESVHRFVAAEQVGSLHERGVDLRISAAEAARLPPAPAAAPPAQRTEGGGPPTPWEHLMGLMNDKEWRSKR